MTEYTKGTGNWDDDDSSQHSAASSQIEPYSDNWIIPFGKHKGKMLLQVPGDYLLWLYENPQGLDTRLKAYIEQNIDSLNQESRIRKSQIQIRK